MKKIELFFSALRVPVDYLMIVLAGILAYFLRIAQPVKELRPLLYEFGLRQYAEILLIMGGVFVIIFSIEGLYDVRSTKKITYNKSNVKQGYRIQLFYGSENGAIRTQNKFREIYPNTSCSLVFDSPNWKIKVGNYKTRLIADKHLQEIITEFGDAIVIEPKKK